MTEITSIVKVPAKVRNALDSLGVPVHLDIWDDDALHGDLTIGDGFVWNATLCSTIAIHHHSDRPDAWRCLLDDIAEGMTRG